MGTCRKRRLCVDALVGCELRCSGDWRTCTAEPKAFTEAVATLAVALQMWVVV